MRKRMPSVVVCALALAALLAAGAGARVGGPSTVSGQDRTWLKTSAQGDVFEIQGGKLALRKSSSTAVRTLAQRLIKDHTKSLDEAQRTAAKLGVRLEHAPTPSEQWELQVVSSFASQSFDHWYSTLEVKDHQQDIQETGDEVSLGSNGDVKKLAAEDLPVLRVHLRLADRAAAASRAG
jgi:putative membrane protein